MVRSSDPTDARHPVTDVDRWGDDLEPFVIRRDDGPIDDPNPRPGRKQLVALPGQARVRSHPEVVRDGDPSSVGHRIGGIRPNAGHDEPGPTPQPRRRRTQRWGTRTSRTRTAISGGRVIECSFQVDHGTGRHRRRRHGSVGFDGERRPADRRCVDSWCRRPRSIRRSRSTRQDRRRRPCPGPGRTARSPPLPTRRHAGGAGGYRSRRPAPVDAGPQRSPS